MFALLPIPLFVIMGEVLFHCGLALKAIDVLDAWLGRIPGRLGLVAIGSATIFAALSGSAMGTTAMLGRILVPDMTAKGYKPSISIGSCMCGGLAMIIPPSAMSVIIAAIAKVSVGKVLIGGVVPGLILSLMYGLYVVGRAWLQPSVAPAYEPVPMSFSQKVRNSILYLIPMGAVIFIVIGLVLLGVATPTESAAMGALTTFIMAFVYKKGIKWDIIKNSLAGTVTVSVMMFMILTGSLAFSQILAFSGASARLVEYTAALQIHPLILVACMQIVVLILGTFMESVAILMICIPIFKPIIDAVGYDGVWFSILMLVNIGVGMKTPPFGLLLFVMKSVAPKEITMEDILRATAPFILIDVIGIAIIMFFPALMLWLPNMVSN